VCSHVGPLTPRTRPHRPAFADVVADVLDRVLAGQPAAFSWRALVDKDVSTNPARAFITVQPVVDYGALEPGARASAAIRALVTIASVVSESSAERSDSWTVTGTTRKPSTASIITGGVSIPASAARNSRRSIGPPGTLYVRWPPR